LTKFVQAFSYCLLGDHFHLLIQARSEQELDLIMAKDRDKPYNWHVSNAFSSFFQPYIRPWIRGMIAIGLCLKIASSEMK
jgi:hypothetical protein